LYFEWQIYDIIKKNQESESEVAVLNVL